jgi:hypothetical protein
MILESVQLSKSSPERACGSSLERDAGPSSAVMNKVNSRQLLALGSSYVGYTTFEYLWKCI